MKKRAKLPRMLLVFTLAAVLAATVVMLLLPKPISVDLGLVRRTELAVTIVEEGRTNVRETYIVSTPVSGRLMRVVLRPGDEVVSGETIVARMLPTSPAILDSRTREQAVAAVEAATATIRLAQANLTAAQADEELAKSELDRTIALFESEIVSKAALERAAISHRARSAARETAEAAIAFREAELENARASLIGLDDIGLANAISDTPSREIPLQSPIDGRILQVFQESETVLQAGAPIVEIGDITLDLEVIVDLISSDAVKVSVGDKVILRDWGQGNDLIGQVMRVDPFGATKTSALGIEEQRVRVEIELLSPPDERTGLGHGYRLEAAIVIWEKPDALVVPSSALFRSDGNWSVFRYADGSAEIVSVRIGESDGIYTEVLGGLSESDLVIQYPSGAIENGSAIVDRSQ